MSSEKRGGKKKNACFCSTSHNMTYMRWWVLTLCPTSEIWAPRFCLMPNPQCLLLFVTQWSISEHQPGQGQWQWKAPLKDRLSRAHAANKSWRHQNDRKGLHSIFREPMAGGGVRFPFGSEGRLLHLLWPRRSCASLCSSPHSGDEHRQDSNRLVWDIIGEMQPAIK